MDLLSNQPPVCIGANTINIHAHIKAGYTLLI